MLIALTQAQRLLSSELANDIKPLGISVDMWITLNALEETPGLAMTKVADKLCLYLPTVTKLIDRMVSDNYVYRKPHQTDRRRVLIFPTDRGLTVLHEARAIAAKFEEKIIQHSDLPKETLLTLLSDLKGAVQS
ncbi:MAG: MarR family transcriptional regulator [Kordiimonadaceae bacterium]|nr:MarR family transcriptional regulator [Kordiimonadaceae bacterium]